YVDPNPRTTSRIIPTSVTVHAVRATNTNTRGMASRAGASIASASRMVATVYIPRGNTTPQYSGSYRNGKRRHTCRHATRMTSMGIHHVAVAQNMSVRPFTNGTISRTAGACGAASVSIAPASVEIATAPMLTQYGGVRSDGCIGKKV